MRQEQQEIFYVNYMYVAKMPEKLEKDGPWLITKWSYKLTVPTNFFIEVYVDDEGKYRATMKNNFNILAEVSFNIMCLPEAKPVSTLPVVIKTADFCGPEDVKPGILYRGIDCLPSNSLPDSPVVTFDLLTSAGVYVRFFTTTLA